MCDDGCMMHQSEKIRTNEKEQQKTGLDLLIPDYPNLQIPHLSPLINPANPPPLTVPHNPPPNPLLLAIPRISSFCDQSYQQQYQKNNKKQLMASLCTPILSNFSSGNVFLLLATSLAGLLTLLTPPSSIRDRPVPPPFGPTRPGFREARTSCGFDKEREEETSTCIGNSLSQIMSNVSSDFKTEREEAGLVHSLELMQEGVDDCDVDTVESCMMSFGDDPNSTENSCQEEDELSDLEDL